MVCTVATAVLAPSAVLASQGPAIAPNAVAVAAGKPVTRAQFAHWMFITAKASNTPHSPLIVPTDPPGFSRCINRARAQIPSLRHTSTSRLRNDCARLFALFKTQVLGFLIEARWYEQAAAAQHIVFTRAQVPHALRVSEHQQFPTETAFKRFLATTGQSVADIRFRVRVNLIYAALLKRAHGDVKALNMQVRQTFKPETLCGRYYVVADCAT
jgi:hypothetical protein